ncbi:hypothetical protein SCLCIDRAFT_32581 [Scleroderma citrinum Foug A]|uniref:Uncharacterized protein n=1 Tax=Scleroderma citrinum Foug A TaxID=1036808 RepID=A0A0C2YS20_9AGAM|nr:hypothetical protein SCLCIDRAFT_32581 [Scleroderma citrinum Foug A]
MAKQLHGLIELLPSSPKWQYCVMQTAKPTKSPVRLFYHDSVECLESLFQHLLFHDKLNLAPHRVYRTAERLVRVYSEWMTGDVAWEIQNKLPDGATLLGIMLSSDKMNISALVGDRCAHPLLLGLANIHMLTHLKISSDVFLLVALLPIPKFIHKHKRMCGMLTDRLLHKCLNIILELLKQAARLGIMMNDPLGNLQLCYTPLASYMVDTPEACMLVGVGGKTLPVTMAMYKHFSDNFQHPSQTKMFTLQQLQNIEVDPDDLEQYFKAAQEYRLNGVSRLFYHNWVLSDPFNFFNPEVLHHWHKFVWDHDIKWSINIIGTTELDFCFSVLHPSSIHQSATDTSARAFLI